MLKMTWICVFLFLTGGLNALEITPNPVMNDVKKGLIREYCREHYGTDSFELRDPRVIVIHYTAMEGLRECLDYFTPDLLETDRKAILAYGKVNVGIHFIIGRDGRVFSIYPEDVIARHTIGLNYCALGIENVAVNEKRLTDEQLASCAELVAELVKRHPTIEYLIGHLEYNNPQLPHYQLVRELKPEYLKNDTPDPGRGFMKRLREVLRKQYNVNLKD